VNRSTRIVIPSARLNDVVGQGVEGYVLDKEGKIVFVTSGAYTEEKTDEIDEFIE